MGRGIASCQLAHGVDVIAAIWLHEKLSILAIVGGILVLGSTLLITVWEELRAARRPADLTRATFPAQP